MRYKMEDLVEKGIHSELTKATLSGNLAELICIEYPGSATSNVKIVNKNKRVLFYLSRKCPKS